VSGGAAALCHVTVTARYCCCCSIYGGELFDRAISEDFLLTEKACVCIMRQICEGVEFIHSHNIIHLDMKVDGAVVAFSRAT